jgi:hypothetical protein
MEDRVEQLRGRLLRRTGWLTPLRACPVHDLPLELCFDETEFGKWSDGHQPLYNHDENRVCWRCDECVGTWLENWFMYRPDLVRASPKERVERLMLTCLACGSRRIGHDCVPACCGEHSCRDCGATFEVSARIVEPGIAPEEDEPLPCWGPVAESFGGTSSGDEAGVRSGHCAEFRSCPKCGTPRELIIVGERTPAEDGTRVAWFCGTCNRSETEGSFHRVRSYFAPDAAAGCDCPTCGSRGALVTRDDGRTRCERCGATAEITIAAAERRRRPRAPR